MIFKRLCSISSRRVWYHRGKFTIRPMIFKRLRLAVFHRVECGIVEETLLETRVMNSECVSDRPYRAHYTSTATRG